MRFAKTHCINIILIIFWALLLLPTHRKILIPEIPIDNFLEIFILLLSIYIFFNLRSNYFLRFLFLFILLVLKFSIILMPPNNWSVCYQDNLAERTFRHSFIDNELPCEKSYIVFSNNLSGYTNTIEYFSDENFEWSGANASNFKLGFFNSKKFNHMGAGSPDRNWLPFEVIFNGEVDSDIKFIKIEYLGELVVNLNGREIKHYKNYQNEQELILNNNSTSDIQIKYKFSKFNKIKILDEYPEGYPYDRYAKLIVVGSEDGTNWSPLKVKSNIFLEILDFLYIFFIVSLSLFTTYKNKYFNILKNKKDTLIKSSLLFLVIYFLINPLSLNIFPVVQLFDTFTLFVLLIMYVYLKRYKPINLELLLVLFIGFYLLLDLDYKLLDFYIRPGGSDSLTYESLSRLVLEGQYFKGGESVYYYSPGIRYFILTSHFLFGERLFIYFVFLNSLTAWTVLNHFKVSLNLPSLLFLIFISSNAINRIFIFGMSEIFALILLLTAIFINKESPLNQIITGILLGLTILVRPVLVLGILFYVFILKRKKIWISFATISFLPLLHNFYFGNEMIFFTRTWNTERTLVVDYYNFENFLFNIVTTLAKNLNYIFMNPFSSDVFIRVGKLLPYVFFVNTLIFIYYSLKYLLNEKNFRYPFVDVFMIILFVLPFSIYDPSFFYPRFLLVPFVLLFIVNIRFVNLFHSK